MSIDVKCTHCFRLDIISEASYGVANCVIDKLRDGKTLYSKYFCSKCMNELINNNQCFYSGKIHRVIYLPPYPEGDILQVYNLTNDREKYSKYSRDTLEIGMFEYLELTAFHDVIREKLKL